MTTREFLLTSLDWNPLAVAGLVLACGLYGLACGWKLPGKSIYFVLGLLFCFLALDSPLSLLAQGTLFSAHMLQHLLLVLVVPPLLLRGLPAAEDPGSIRGSLIPSGSRPLVAWSAGVGAMWFWHVPVFCDAAASNGAVHALQTFSLLFLGVLFWRPIAGPRMEERLSPLMGIIYLFTACVACTLLGVWISFAPEALCPVFTHPQDPLGLLPMVRGNWGLNPAVDQQIGGLLMWVPACLVYLGAILVLLGRFYGQAKGVPGPPNKMEEKNG